MSGNFLSCSKGVKDTLEVPEVRCDYPRAASVEMGIISPRGENLQDFLELRQVPSTYDIPVSTREEARKSRPHAQDPRFRLKGREEESFPYVVGKEFPAFPSHLKRMRSPQERREELQGRATIPRVSQMSQSIPGKPVFPALTRLSSQGSTHTTGARGTAL